MKKQFKILALVAVAAFVLVLAGSALQTPDTAKDPVCGMNVKIATAKYTSEYKGTKYYFCGESCKTSFDKDPEKYLAKPGSGMMGGMGGGMMKHDMAASQTPDTAKDPVCGMSVKISTAKYSSDYKGTKYYFCSEGCKTSFDKEPEKYLAKQTPPAGGGMMAGGKMESCPIMLPDVEKKVQNTKDGVIITLSSKNAETVKKIQDHMAKMAAGKMHEGGAGEAGCPMGASCPMNKK